MPDKLMQKEVIQFYKENEYELINEYNGYNSKLITSSVFNTICTFIIFTSKNIIP